MGNIYVPNDKPLPATLIKFMYINMIFPIVNIILLFYLGIHYHNWFIGIVLFPCCLFFLIDQSLAIPQRWKKGRIVEQKVIYKDSEVGLPEFLTIEKYPKLEKHSVGADVKSKLIYDHTYIMYYDSFYPLKTLLGCRELSENGEEFGEIFVSSGLFK